MHLEKDVHPAHVEEAHRIFKISTLNAAASGMSSGQAQDTPRELTDIVTKIEEAIVRRVAIGTKISYPRLRDELLGRFDNEFAITNAIMAL